LLTLYHLHRFFINYCCLELTFMILGALSMCLEI